MAGYRFIQALVSGKVQGVWFRQSTKQVADSLDICGYAKNLADGKVEVVAYGREEAIEQLLAFLHRGPENARVDQVTLLDNGSSTLSTDKGFKTL